MNYKNDTILPYQRDLYQIAIPDASYTVFHALGLDTVNKKPEKKPRTEEKELFQRKNGISATATLINFVKGMIGPGCLSLPLAFKQAGLVATFVLIVLFGFLNNYCMLQLVHCSQRLSQRRGDAAMDYGTVAYEACAKSFKRVRKFRQHARIFVNAAIISLQIGVCSVFYVFIATHVKEIFDQISEIRISELGWMLLILAPMILISMLRTLKTIAIISTFGNVLMILSLVFIFQYLLRAEHHWASLPWITNFEGVMTACGSILYSFEGQAMVLPMENRLRNPHDMVGPFGVLSIGMSLVTSVYAAAGLAGYVTYGSGVRGSITQNLPNELMFIIVRAMLTLVIYFGYIIQLYVIVDMTWPRLRVVLRLDLHSTSGDYHERNGSSSDRAQSIAFTASSASISVAIPPDNAKRNAQKAEKAARRRQFGAEILFRAALVLLTMSIAICVPNLDNIIPLVGVTAGMLLAFVFPATIDTILFVPEMLARTNGRVTRAVAVRVALNAILCAVGAFGLVFGLRSNIDAILRRNVQ